MFFVCVQRFIVRRPKAGVGCVGYPADWLRLCVPPLHSSGRVGWTNQRLCSCFLLSVTAADVFVEVVRDAQRKKTRHVIEIRAPHATDQGSLSLF